MKKILALALVLALALTLAACGGSAAPAARSHRDHCSRLRGWRNP